MFHHRPLKKPVSTREIVIIVVLILMIAFVAVPYYFRQKADSRAVASANNLQQWGIALNLYLIENGSRFPQAGMPLDGPVNHYAWYNALPLYISQKPYSEIDPAERPRPGEHSLWMDPSVDAEEGPPAGDPFFAYAMNRWLQPKLGEPSYKTFDLADPSSVVFLTETASPVPAIKSSEASFRYLTPEKEPAAHVLFCDGHVELVGRAALADAPNLDDPKQPLGKVNWIPFFDAPVPEGP